MRSRVLDKKQSLIPKLCNRNQDLNAKEFTCIPANAASAAVAVFAEISLPMFSACERSNLPFKKARKVNSPKRGARSKILKLRQQKREGGVVVRSIFPCEKSRSHQYTN